MLAEGEQPWLHAAGFNTTYEWKMMRMMGDVYNGKKSLVQLDSLLNSDMSAYPGNSSRMFFTTNHDENSWNGTEFEKYGDAYKTFAVFTQTIYHSIPLIYNGQEVPNKKRLKFFVKDTISWNQYAMAPFYTTLLALRKTNPALAVDASYKKLTSSNDAAIFAYLRQDKVHKVAIILNLSGKPQKITIKDKSLLGIPQDIFSRLNEKIEDKHLFELAPWGYLVYDYR